MTNYGFIVSTVPDADEAKNLASLLVQNKLAACVNIVPGVLSIYSWEDKICEDTELILFIKTKKELFEQVKDFILKTHSYTVPEVIMLPIEAGHADYLNWIKDNTI